MRKLWFLTLAGALLLGLGCQKDVVPQEEVDRDLILEYLSDNGLTATEHPSGLFYNIEAPGGSEKPALSNEVRVRYKGMLRDGYVFDQTTGTETRNFLLQSLIQGWRIGIPLLGRGGKGKFYVPSALGYGSQSLPGIPGNSVLVFEIELVDFQ